MTTRNLLLPLRRRLLLGLPGLLLGLPLAAAELPTGTASVAVPGSLRIRYAIRGRIGILPYSANGLLQWVQDGQTYDSRMEVHLFLLGSRVQISRGRITPAGLQPLYFNDRVHNDRTVEFDYAKAMIRFSEGTPPTPLPPGAQDALSVFMQLGSLVAAAPQRYPAGTELIWPVMSIYGPDTLRFVVAGEEKLHLPGGEQTTLKLTRAATKPDEPNAELWLAPALGWLPARIRLYQDNGDFVDQLWRASEAP
jgi:hypothetical protein